MIKHVLSVFYTLGSYAIWMLGIILLLFACQLWNDVSVYLFLGAWACLALGWNMAHRPRD